MAAAADVEQRLAHRVDEFANDLQELFIRGTPDMQCPCQTTPRVQQCTDDATWEILYAHTGLCTDGLISMLAAPGTSILRNVYMINRGYEEIAERLNSIGADIEILK